MRTYINVVVAIVAIVFTSCVKDIHDEVLELPKGQAYATFCDFIVDEQSRTALVYNYNTGGMDFSWIGSGGDKLGIFTTMDYRNEPRVKVEPGKTTAYKYVVTDLLNTDGARKRAWIASSTGFTLTPDYGFTSYYPYDETKIEDPARPGYPMPFNVYPISYRGQEQTKNVDMGLYYGSGWNAELYTQSESNASKHLAPFDYLLSTEKRPTEDDIVEFPFEHLGSVVRFFLRTPSTVQGKYRFHTIRVVADKKVFYKDALVDMSNCTDEEPIVALNHLTMVGAPENNLKLSLNNDETGYFEMDYPTRQYSRYIVAYMMLNPVDLSSVLDDADNIYLYLEGSKVEGPIGSETLTPAYFKSAPLAHKAFRAGFVYQWTDLSLQEEKDPIELQAITVEQWREGVWNNTENGNGTHLW